MNELLCPSACSRSALLAALEQCEEIAAKDRSNLYQVSRFFENRARYDAFIAMYAVMRIVDDLVDSVPDKDQLRTAERDALLIELDGFEQQILSAYRGEPQTPLATALCAAVQTFPVPLKLWKNFMGAMRFDVTTPRFADFTEFVHYGEGATVAPTSIYVYLLTAAPSEHASYHCSFDFESCGRELGLFAYLAHILRDLVRDLSVGKSGLLYISHADLHAHDLDENSLRSVVASGQADARFHGLVRTLCQRAAIWERRGAQMAALQRPLMAPDCAFILSLIISMYSKTLRRIEEDPSRILRSESLLSPADQTQLLIEAAESARYSSWHQHLASPVKAESGTALE